MLLPPAPEDPFVYILLVSSLTIQHRNAALSDSGLHPACILFFLFSSSTQNAPPSPLLARKSFLINRRENLGRDGRCPTIYDHVQTLTQPSQPLGGWSPIFCKALIRSCIGPGRVLHRRLRLQLGERPSTLNRRLPVHPGTNGMSWS
jgi:hypothetical protein